METIKRQIFVLRDTIKDTIDYNLGTDMVPIEYHVMDFTVPATAAAVVYVLKPDGELDKILADVLDNVISFQPAKEFFLEGLNAIQIRVVDNNKTLVSFTETVRARKNMKFDDDAEAQQKTLIEQLLTKMGESDGNMKIERAERIAGDENEKAERNKAIAAEQKEREKEIDVERQRINNLAKLQEGSTTGDAELADIRVGADGKTYENAGEAVRGQVSSLSEDITEISRTYNLIMEQGGINTDTGDNVGSESIRIRSSMHFFPQNAKIYFDVPLCYILLEYSREGTYIGIYKRMWESPRNSLIVDKEGYYRLLVRDYGGQDISPDDYTIIVNPTADIYLTSLLNDTVGFGVQIKSNTDLYKHVSVSEGTVTLKKDVFLFGKYRIYLDKDIVIEDLIPNTYLVLEMDETKGNCILSCVSESVIKDKKNIIGILGFISSNKRILFFDANYKIGEVKAQAEALEEKINEIEKSRTRVFTIGQNDNVAKIIMEAMQYKDSVVYIEPYEHDCYQEWEDYFGVGYFENLASGRGIELQNGIHIIGRSGCKLNLHYTGNNDYVQSDFSLFNNPAGGSGYTLENIEFETSKIRYCIHDERGSDVTLYKVKYSRCRFSQDNSESTWDHSRACIGGGLGLHGDVIVEDCIFDTVTSEKNKDSVAYHNSAGAGAKNSLVIKGCYCKGDSTLQIASYGESTLKSDILISGNSFGSPIEEVHWGPQDNFNIMYISNEIRNL